MTRPDQMKVRCYACGIECDPEELSYHTLYCDCYPFDECEHGVCYDCDPNSYPDDEDEDDD